MPTLLLPSRYTPDTIKLWKAALATGWGTDRLQNWHPAEDLRNREPVIYGEPMFAVAVAGALNLSLLEPTLEWLSVLPQCYLNRKVHFMDFGEVSRVIECSFIKPADDKCFPAGVYESGHSLMASYNLPDDVPVLVSEVVEWEVEYRCFVRDGQVLAISPYLRDGELVETKDETWPAPPKEVAEAKEFAIRILADAEVSFPPAAVLDVGKIVGQGWSVIEANPAWSSGIYGCDPSQVLLVLRRACLPVAEVIAQDRIWMVDRQSPE